MIEILTTGLSNSVQDLGRFGHLDAGVGRSGAMDGQALRLANRLVGNEENAAGLEIAIFPFRLRFEADCRIAIAGADAPASLAGRDMPAFWAAAAKAGEELRVDPPLKGARVIIAFEGGIDVPVVLSSRSTDLKSGWGGFEGRGLKRGDRIPLHLPAKRTDWSHLPGGFGMDVSAWRSLAGESAVLRILPGAEWQAFGKEGQDLLTQSVWQLGPEANRQGYRLEGPALHPERRRELFSHGIMPGTVQVPPNGQPIIQLAEANTCGGYPKIAHVIEADLWRLAQLRPGDRLAFRPVTRREAIEALRAETDALAALAQEIRLLTRDYSHAFDGTHTLRPALLRASPDMQETSP